MKLINHVLIMACVIFLTSCSYISSSRSVFNGQSKTYLTARSIPPLRIPPGIASSAFHSYYPVPDRDYPESAKNVSLVPPGLAMK